MIKIELKNFKISNDLPFVLIVGPCVIENESHSLFMAEKINKICEKLKINFIYKSSFDKANRTSLNSSRGVGLENALNIFDEILTGTRSCHNSFISGEFCYLPTDFDTLLYEF